jgi:hypothetical protein
LKKKKRSVKKKKRKLNILDIHINTTTVIALEVCTKINKNLADKYISVNSIH